VLDRVSCRLDFDTFIRVAEIRANQRAYGIAASPLNKGSYSL
jgi:hypothetical protein